MAYIYPIYHIVSITSIIMFMLRYSVWHIFTPDPDPCPYCSIAKMQAGPPPLQGIPMMQGVRGYHGILLPFQHQIVHTHDNKELWQYLASLEIFMGLQTCNTLYEAWAYLEIEKDSWA